MSRHDVPDHIQTGFTRQRRNLMALTLVIFLFYHWEAKFTELSFLGNTIDINKGENVYLVLWSLLFYWLWRYKNYLCAIGDLGISYELKRIRLYNLAKILNNKSTTREFWAELRQLNELSREEIDQAENEGLELHLGDAGFRQRKVRFEVKSFESPVESRGDNVYLNYKASFLDLIRANSIALNHLVNNTRMFSEYVLPPLLAVSLLVYCLCTRWIPSLI